MQRRYKLYMMFGMSCILNCCPNKVPLTAMYLCLFLSLKLDLITLAAVICVANFGAFREIGMAVVCQVFKNLYGPV